ncbi:MAG: lipopolysaccharide heptosyltransferase II [Betaproteobacteria bacterium]|nr:lipopolysaccharide heptosyltransferase II [Betaproteobacteria bacterium]
MPRILVVAPNWIGDALMAQPLLARLRERVPRPRTEVLAPAWVAPVLARMPEVDEVIASPFDHGWLELGARRRLGRELRARGYEEAIVLPNSWKSALVPFFARVPRRTGYLGEARYALLNAVHRAPNDARGPMARHYARLAGAPGSEPPEPLARPRLRLDPQAAARTARRFGFAAARPNAVFCPGAEYGPAKRWPAEHFAALAKLLAARAIDVWLLGSANDAAACDAVAQAAGGAARSLAGRTSLDEAIELVGRADFVVTNDSGLMHVAAALDRPQAALFGSSSPKHTPPLSERARALWLGIECSPCYARECPLGHLRCLRELAPERVLAALGELGVLPSAPVT